ncbi:MAG: GGDEF domain-containing protein [Clostridium sp.]|nr:GGDEF domain-containing protein [Clostridium sp.]MCM1547838.1 GGDEF domain-containing protein [Ruminococcus sp.]
MKNVINIAVIVAGIDEEYQNTILTGIQDFAESHDVNFSYFIAFGGILKNKRHDNGEFNIYNLINFEKFDGAVLLTNTISSPQITEILTERINKAGIPAACIDNDLSDFYYIGIDNFKAMQEMVEHVVSFHKVKRINYISGPDDNPESILRMKAYKSVLEKHNIPIDEDRIYHGFFRGQDARAAINEFINSGMEFPEAIICANDAMALSAIIELEKEGKRVPEDVIVTGFDNTYQARNYFPAVSSVKRPLRLSGYTAAKKVYDAINGIESDRKEILNTECIFTHSCGCTNYENYISTSDDVIEFKKSFYRTIETHNIIVPIINRMYCEFEECLTIEECTDVLKRFVNEINCEKFVFCLCDDWLSGYDDVDYENDEKPKSYTKEGYTENVNIILDYENGRFNKKGIIKSADMLPDLYIETGQSNHFFFVPVHFRERCLGYCVIKNSMFPMQSGLFQTWIMSVCNSIENIRKIVCLDKMVSELNRISIMDPLCQIYNRNGFSKNAAAIYQACIVEKREVMVMFIDMDGLKYINDRFGHNDGDYALIQCSLAIKNACDRNEIFARYGGDEFIVFADYHTDADARKLTDKIYDHMKKFNRFSDKPYAIDASIGYVITPVDEGISLSKVISMADQTMYENKKRRKEERLEAGLESFIR